MREQWIVEWVFRPLGIYRENNLEDRAEALAALLKPRRPRRELQREVAVNPNMSIAI